MLEQGHVDKMLSITKNPLRHHVVCNDVNRHVNRSLVNNSHNVCTDANLFLNPADGNSKSAIGHPPNELESQVYGHKNRKTDSNLLSFPTDTNWYKIDLWYQQPNTGTEQQNYQISPLSRNEMDNCSRICSQNEKEMPKKNGILLNANDKLVSNSDERKCGVWSNHHQDTSRKLGKAERGDVKDELERKVVVLGAGIQASSDYELQLANVPRKTQFQDLDLFNPSEKCSVDCSDNSVPPMSVQMDDRDKASYLVEENMTPTSLTLKNRVENNENNFFQRRLRDSVSSDPEIYAKSSISSAKLSAQFKKLKYEFLALRSTTTVFQQLMNKVFDDLKWLKLMHQQDNFYWMKEHPREIPHSSSENGKLEFSSDRLLSRFAETQAGKYLTAEGNNGSPETSEKAQAQNPSSAHQNISHVTSNLRHEANPPISRTFTSSRPYSDNYSAHSKLLREQESTVTPSLSYHFDHSGKILQPFDKKHIGKTHLRLSPTLNKPNPKLHVSECSIDSGYQDSSVQSPPDKINRLSSSRLRTQSSSVGESSIENSKIGTNLDTVPKSLNDQSSVTTIPNVYVFHNSQKTTNSSLKTRTTTIRPNFSNVSMSRTDDKHLGVDRIIDTSQIRSHDHKFEDSSSIHQRQMFTFANDGKDFSKEGTWIEQNRNHVFIPDPTRPIPKQRTRFLPKTTNQTLNNTASDVNERDREKQLDHRGGITSSLVNGDGEQSKIVGFAPVTNLLSLSFAHNQPINSEPAQTIQHHESLVKYPTKQLPSRILADEYNQGMASKKKDISSSFKQKEMNSLVTKVKLRNNDVTGSKKVDDERVAQKKVLERKEREDLSVVRRRSMRLMQELQILGFEDFNIDSNQSDDEMKKGPSYGRQDVSETDGGCASFTSVTGYEVSPPFAKACENAFGDITCLATTKENVSKTTKKKEDLAMIPNEKQVYPNVMLPLTASISSLREYDSVSPLSILSSIPTPINDPTNIPDHFTSRSSPAKFAVFVPSLIRPKPSLVGSIKSPSGSQKNTCKSLKLQPNSKSAFRPVAALNMRGSTLNGQSALNTSSFRDKNDSPSDIKRRTSLPCMSISNKQRYLNLKEGIESVNDHRAHNQGLPSGVSTNSHPINAYPNEEIVESVISTETAKVTSYEFGDTQTLKDSGNASKTLYSCSSESSGKLKNVDKGSIRCSHHSFNKHRSSGSLHSTRNSKEENGNFYLLEKRSTNIIPSSHCDQSNSNENKVFLPWMSPLKNSAKQTKEDIHRSASMNRPEKKREKVHPTSSPHNYETVALSSNVQSKSPQFARRQPGKKNLAECEPNTNQPTSRSRSHSKSTVSLIKASLFGKFSKSSRNSHLQKTSDQRHSEEPSNLETRRNASSKSKIKEKKSKNNKTESKASNRSLVRRFSKERSKPSPAQSNPVPNPETTLVLPDNDGVGYGHADSEVMERFLAATVAYHAHPPKSPLQRLRSSLRATRNKHRHLHENRIKDDMDLRGMDYPLRLESNQVTKVCNGQECTYV